MEFQIISSLRTAMAFLTSNNLRMAMVFLTSNNLRTAMWHQTQLTRSCQVHPLTPNTRISLTTLAVTVDTEPVTTDTVTSDIVTVDREAVTGPKMARSTCTTTTTTRPNQNWRSDPLRAATFPPTPSTRPTTPTSSSGRRRWCPTT